MADYGLIVIGAGPGGYVAAIRAAQYGMKVAIVEKRDVGGTCLNRGCIPTKSLMHTASLLTEITHATNFGLDVSGVSLDLDRVYARKDEVVTTLRGGVEGLLAANGVEIIRGEAFIPERGTVRVKDAAYTADNLLIATGSRPARLPIPGMDLPGVLTSDEILESPMRQKSAVIIGGGVIGVEFATILGAFGCEVTIIESMDRVLPLLDREISQNLAMILKKRGVKINTGAMLQKIEGSGGQLTCTYTVKGGEETVSSEAVLVSVGRRANTENLFDEELGIELDRGMIPVSDTFETAVPGIYAIGDVVKGGIQLAHVASAQGMNAVAAMCGKPPAMDMAAIPSCVYTTPEIATVGLTADEAKAAGIEVNVSKYIMSANGKTVIEMADRGFMKLVFSAGSGALLGAHLMCSRATDMIGELALAVSKKLTAEDIAGTIHPHPTFVEAVGEAAENALGHAIHIMPKK